MIFIIFFPVIITDHSALAVLRVISVTSHYIVRTRKPPASLEKTSWTLGEVFICWDDHLESITRTDGQFDFGNHWGCSWRMDLSLIVKCYCTAMQKGMTTHSSILAWRISWTEEPGELWSVGSQRVGHNWAIHAHTHRHCAVIVISEVGITRNKEGRKHKPSPSDNVFWTGAWSVNS